jgi:hypothetical protein
MYLNLWWNRYTVTYWNNNKRVHYNSNVRTIDDKSVYYIDNDEKAKDYAEHFGIIYTRWKSKAISYQNEPEQAD